MLLSWSCPLACELTATSCLQDGSLHLAFVVTVWATPGLFLATTLGSLSLRSMGTLHDVQT